MVADFGLQPSQAPIGPLEVGQAKVTARDWETSPDIHRSTATYYRRTLIMVPSLTSHSLRGVENPSTAAFMVWPILFLALPIAVPGIQKGRGQRPCTGPGRHKRKRALVQDISTASALLQNRARLAAPVASPKNHRAHIVLPAVPASALERAMRGRWDELVLRYIPPKRIELVIRFAVRRRLVVRRPELLGERVESGGQSHVVCPACGTA